jgi:hypothetical protein
MFDSGTLGQIVDGLFSSLVLFLTWRSFSPQPQLVPEKSEKWQAELRSLADLLRELISEAGAASSALDRNLLRRKEDLERIVQQAEEAKRSLQDALDTPVPTPAPKAEASRKSSRKKKAGPAAELPNESWSAERRSNPGRMTSQQQASYAAAGREIDDDELAELAALQGDTFERTSRETAPPDLRHAGGSSLHPLASSIESAAETEDDALEVSSLSALNPTAVRVAERLLTAGQEIHVVARKLELPVAVVRALDRVIRRQTKTGTSADSREVVAKGIFPRQKQAEAPPVRHAPLFRGQSMTRKQLTL